MSRRLAVGDKVEYVGSDANLKKQYVGILEVAEIAKFRFDGYACFTPYRIKITSWIEAKDLRLVEKAKIQ